MSMPVWSRFDSAIAAAHACIDRGIVDGAKCGSGVLAIRHACNRLGLLASVFFQSKEPIQSATLDECRLVSISYMVTSPRYFYDFGYSGNLFGFDDVHVGDDDHEVVLSRHVMPFA